MAKKEATFVPKWAVTIGNGGKVTFIDQEGWEAYKRNFEGREGDIILKDKVKDRSRQEEKYFHAVVVKSVAEAMDITPDDAKSFLKELFLKV
jgi:hypothetical protein